MDHQTQSFLDLTGMTDLVELVPDSRAAWLWSHDGGRVLWANAAGAAFFSAHSIRDLANLVALERSPARPHIARIAASGFTDRFSIDRLRFYRGLRVMLLTCQCKKIDLENGGTAALIVCADKGFATTKDPVSAFSQLLPGSNTSVFVLNRGTVSEQHGALTGTPEELALPNGQRALLGPLALDDALHNGAFFKLSKDQNLVVLDNEPIEAPLPDDPETQPSEEPAVPAAEEAMTADGASEWLRADSDAAVQPSLMPDAAADEDVRSDNSAVDEPADEAIPTASASPVALDESDDDVNADAADAPPAEAGPAEAEAATVESEDGPAEAEPASTTDEKVADFVFKPGRRPIRFAWKMDIDQRFTFLSDEFADVVGPESADLVGLTWAEVAEKFDIDQRASIARALDRRDTWSGKTVDWPVTGEALRVPVDMAALPAFDRNRKFEGYRGFGVCRASDAKPGARIADLSPAMVAFDETLTASDLTETDTDSPGTGSPGTDETEATETGTTAKTSVTAGDNARSGLSPEDLTPKQPDALAGKTFLGASAAALVGSLSRFTGAAASTRKESAETASPPPAMPSPNPASEPSLLPKEPALNEPQAETGDLAHATDQPLPAAIDMDEVLDQAAAPSPDPDAAGEDVAVEDTAKDVALNDENAASGIADERLTEVSDNASQLDEELASEGTDSGLEAVSEQLHAPAVEVEPSGISGSAPLDASEIESAVKSLQKSYNKERKQAPDLFTGAQEIVPEQDAADALPAESELADADKPATLENAATDDPAAPPQTSQPEGEEPEPAVENAPEDTPATTPENALDEEREFFEETAAFEAEELAKEFEEDLAASDNVESLTPDLGDNVIPLATVKPRVVPVDTSGLSRPERRAFRKIAEALGARLEGDLEGWDEPDADEPAPEDLPPEVPEAGPIDPTLLDRLPIGIAIVHDREVLYANKALLSMLGYKSIGALSEAGGLEALFIDEAEDLPDAEGMEGELDETMKIRLADGGVQSVDAHMHTVPWNGSRGLMISVTERTGKPGSAAEPVAPNFFAEVRSELDKARDQISEMDTILETATDGVLVLDEEGTILKVNGSAEALFSSNRGDMIGAPFINFLAPESHRSAEDYLDGLSRNGVASILNDGREVLGKVPSGGLIPLFMTMGRISSADDTKYCAVLRDITQWKTAEEELTQAKRQAENASSQKSDFLAKISHEIRTPLNAIIGFSEVMMEERFGPIGNDRYKDYLKDIRTSGSHIMSLVNDLLDLSKIEAGKLDLKFSSVSANEIINECVALMQPQANRERVIIRASVPDTVPNIVADPRSLRQIVLNLLSNGIKYNKSGGQVILSTTLEPNGEVALRVRDTGAGMTPKQLTAALEPFRQLHTAHRGGGTGLGLPLTKALSEANRAQFHIDSVPDQGTLVEITFPTERVLSE